MDDSKYIHGTHPAEQSRLARLNQLLNPSSLRKLRLREGERVLDVGAGLGQLAVEMAEAVGPAGFVLAVERDPRQLQAARQKAQTRHLPQLRLQQGDATRLELSPAERASFDVVHGRFILEHLPDPQAALREWATALRPGGRICLEDDDHSVLRLWPEVPGFATLWEAHAATYQALGNDPRIGRKLVQHLHAVGLQPTGADILFFGACQGQAEFELMTANFHGILDMSREAMLATNRISADAIDETLERFREWTGRPDAALWYERCWAEGRLVC